MRHHKRCLEVLHATMFGDYEFKRRAALVTPLFEYEFSSDSRIRPNMVFGVGFTQYRTLLPGPASTLDRLGLELR